MRAAESIGGEGLTARVLSSAWWPHAKRTVTLAFFALITWFLFQQAREIDWHEVGRAVRRLPNNVLFIAAGLAALSFAVYTCFDLIGRYYTHHKLATRRVIMVAFISYAFNLNLGSLVGAIGFRYRLYSRFGLSTRVITRIMGLSMLTNWLGYFVLGGIVLCFFTPNLPQRWQAQWQGAADMLPWLGALLLLISGAYLLACALAKRRHWHWRTRMLPLPTLRMAIAQLTLSVLNWSIMAAVIYALFQGRIDFPSVLGVLLISAVAGVITHVPANVGVMEAVFLAMLSSRMPPTQILAALLAYRALYYLLPLLLALLLFGHVEWQQRCQPPANEA